MSESDRFQSDNPKPKRDALGRYLPGHGAPGPGRPSGRSLTEALREVADPEEAARLLWRRAKKSDTVLMYVYDRLEGRPKQAVDLKHEGEPPAVQAIKEMQQKFGLRVST